MRALRQSPCERGCGCGGVCVTGVTCVTCNFQGRGWKGIFLPLQTRPRKKILSSAASRGAQKTCHTRHTRHTRHSASPPPSGRPSEPARGLGSSGPSVEGQLVSPILSDRSTTPLGSCIGRDCECRPELRLWDWGPNRFFSRRAVCARLSSPEIYYLYMGDRPTGQRGEFTP